MGTIRAIFKWLGGVHSRCRAAYRYHSYRRVENAVCKSINVIEFNGRLYISFNGAPIVRADDLKLKATEVLAQSRDDYLSWIAKFDA